MENDIVNQQINQRINVYNTQFLIISSFYKNIFKEICEILNLNFDDQRKIITNEKIKLKKEIKNICLLTFYLENDIDILDLWLLCQFNGATILWNTTYNHCNVLFKFEFNAESVENTHYLSWGNLYTRNKINNAETIKEILNKKLKEYISITDYKLYDICDIKLDKLNIKLNDNLDENLCITYDIDAIMGILDKNSISFFFNSPFYLKFNPYSSKKIRSNTNYYKNNYNKTINLKKSTNFHIGYFYTNLGNIDCFIYLENNKKSSISLVNNMYVALVDIIENNNDYKLSKITTEFLKIDKKDSIISGFVRKSNVLEFFSYLNNKLIEIDNFEYYIEILGNKKLTSTTYINQLLLELNQTFNIMHGPNISIDICVQVHTENKNEFVMPKESFFKNLSIQSCFSLFFDNNIIAYNSPMKTMNGKKIKYNLGLFEKLNFYSTFEDTFAKIRNKNIIPKMTMYYFKNYVNCKIGKSNKINKIIKSFADFLENKFDDNIPYRFEIRINPIMIVDSIKILLNNLNNSILIMPINEFEIKIKSTINEYLEFTEIKSLDDICNLFFIEMIFHRQYLMGDKNPHFMPNEIIRQYKTYEHEYTKINNLKNFLKNTEIFNKNKKLDILINVYNYLNKDDEITDIIKNVFLYDNLEQALDTVIILMNNDIGMLINKTPMDIKELQKIKYVTDKKVEINDIINNLFFDDNRFKKFKFR